VRRLDRWLRAAPAARLGLPLFAQARHQTEERINDPPRQIAAQNADEHLADLFAAARITLNEHVKVGTMISPNQAGESAATTVTLPAAVLRSTALTIQGTAGIPARNVLVELQVSSQMPLVQDQQ
jgi:hypothetical protein